jgi:hypothetical protein
MIDIYYNKDINNDIYVFNFEKELNKENLEKIIGIRSLDNELKSPKNAVLLS